MTGDPVRRRADTLLVERGLVESRSQARASIEAGLVTAAGKPVEKPSDRLAVDCEITAGAPHPWVSRGGVKLAHALDAFAIDPACLACLDVGASTGGFTDVLLARGARRVYAVDVGRGQLHPRLAGDPRVVSLERIDIRKIDPEWIPDRIGLVTVDVSFISLRLVCPVLHRFMSRPAYLVVLVKPQFEVGRENVARGGIVRDAAARDSAVAGIGSMLSGLGLDPIGTVPSPITGGDGNRETLMGARLA